MNPFQMQANLVDIDMRWTKVENINKFNFGNIPEEEKYEVTLYTIK